MKRSGLLILLGILIVLGFIVFGSYNGLVSKNENVNKAWNNVQAEYQNRADLVGNLVSTVKGAAEFEQKTLTDVVEARSKATSLKLDANNLTTEQIAQFQSVQNQLSGSLSRLLATVEAYPNLKATESFQMLQKQLEQIENNIKNSRKTFNEAINEYNVKRRSFPTVLFSGLMGFHPKEGFKSDEGAEKAPNVGDMLK